MTPPHYTGAASEHLAAYYYLSTGAQVYWPAAQQGCVDFVIDKDGKLLKVQVKTATWNRAAPPWHYLQCRIRSTNKYDAANYDIVFVVIGMEMWEIPASELVSSNICLKTTKPDGKEYRWDKFKVNG